MIYRAKIIFIIIGILIFGFPIISVGQNCYDYKNTTDEIKAKITFDTKLHSDFFESHEASYPWYIIKNDDGTFESALDREITTEDKMPIEHTSNCVSTHQGKHIMTFCDARYEAGILQLEIYGGMPAYSSSLLITIKDSEFLCHFKAAYPAPVSNCKWTILSKKLTLKNHAITSGKRINAWVSVEFKETATYRGETTTHNYKIEGYLKPLVDLK